MMADIELSGRGRTDRRHHHHAYASQQSRIALVSLTIETETEDYGPLRHYTWTTGRTQEEAVRRWMKQNKRMAGGLIACQLVTPIPLPPSPPRRHIP